MSKEYWGYENEKGDTGFLAGVVDVLSDNLEMLCDFGYALDADVFYIKDNNLSLLNDAVKRRFNHYNTRCGCGVSKENIDALDFQLEKLNVNVNEFLCDKISNYASSKNISKEVNEFLTELCWHLQEPLCIYRPIKTPDENIHTLGQIYLYMAWEYFFISYYDYLILIVFGTVE